MHMKKFVDLITHFLKGDWFIGQIPQLVSYAMLIILYWFVQCEYKSDLA